METYELNTGAKIPVIGFGTWNIAEGDEVIEAVGEALRVGYRQIDTAKLYGNERGVGEAIRQSGVDRQDIFVTTKLWNSDHYYELALKAFEDSMKRLNIGYVNLYLIHSPATALRLDAWRALEQIYKAGKAKAVGVSNYDVDDLKEVMESSTLVPAVNQIVFHPFVYREQVETLEFCKLNKIIIQAYSPLARARQMAHPVISKIAKAHNKSEAQVMLRWAIQHGTVPIPKSVTPSRIKENLDVFDFELSSDEMSSLNNLSN